MKLNKIEIIGFVKIKKKYDYLRPRIEEALKDVGFSIKRVGETKLIIAK